MKKLALLSCTVACMALWLTGCPKPTCGNGTVNDGEACDDGNEVSGDGCSAVCTLESVCGDGVVVPGEECDDGNTAGGDGCAADCTLEGPASCGDGVVQAGEACDDGNVDNTDSCLTTCEEATCGDGVVQGGVEDCDDANTDDTDDCTSACTDATCGDGFLQAGEDCDDGNADDTDACPGSCLDATCGDGFTLAGMEDCDDGNTMEDDACLNDCTAASCGDGNVQLGVEDCDDGNAAEGDGCDSNCTAPGCPNGIVDVALGEACDDGNAVAGDGCDAACADEFCGDGVVNDSGAEACDDGNGAAGDCCSPTCTIETVGCECNDGADNDGDALVDFPADPGCTVLVDDIEQDECSPGVSPVPLPASGTVTSTAPSMGVMEGSCTGSFVPTAGEEVWQVDIALDADVVITTNLPGTTADTNLYVRTDCADGATEIGCSNQDSGPPFSAFARLDLFLTAGTYYIVVDPEGGSFLDYVLQVSGTYPSGGACDAASPNFTCDAALGETCGAGGFCVPAQCSNGADDDGDAVTDFPAEPGCTGIVDDDETDPPVPPVCSDGVDNDGDSFIDFPSDIGCFFAADGDEDDQCVAGVPLIVLPSDGHYFGSTTSATGLIEGSCTLTFVPSGEENAFIIDVPGDADVTFDTALPGTVLDTGLYVRGVCNDDASELGCSSFAFPGDTLTVPLAAGTYFLIVDGVNGSTGPYELQVSGILASGQPCDPADLVFTCDTAGGYACSGFVCTLAQCNNTTDDDGDALADYPADPGCTAIDDDDETDTCPAGPGCPACANALDDDGDALTDYPADLGCSAASDPDESGCVYSFPAGDPQGWTFTTNCTAGAVDWQVDSFRSTSPTDSLYMGDPSLRTYECSFFSHIDDATSAPITLAASGSEVSFHVWIAVEGGSFYDQLRLQVIPAAGMPVTVWTHSDDPFLADGSSGGVFVAETVDLSAFDGQTVQLQFHFDTIDAAVNDTEGVYVDDIIVSAVGACF